MLVSCPMHRELSGVRNFKVLNNKARCLLTPSLPASDPGSAAAWDSKRISPRHQSCLLLTRNECPSNNDNEQNLELLAKTAQRRKACISFYPKDIAEWLKEALNYDHINQGAFNHSIFV